MATHTSNITRRLPAKSLLALSLLVAFAPGVAARTLIWDGGGPQDTWSSKAGSKSNWSSSNVPANGDSLIFAGTTRLSNSNNIANLSVKSLTFAAGAGAFTLGGNALTLSNASGSVIENMSSTQQTLNLGMTVLGSSIWKGGSNGMTFNGAVAVGDGAHLTLARNITVNKQSTERQLGVSGTATLSILSGSVVNDGNSNLGVNGGSTGTVNVDGAGSSWQINNNLRIGQGGSGILEITNGGQVASTFSTLGDSAGASGVANVSGSGSKLSTLGLSVGFGGTGALNITNGGIVESASATYIGNKNGSKGTVTVTGANSKLSSREAIFVGSGFGDGAVSTRASLNILNGASVTAPLVIISSANGKSNTVNVTGGGSTFNAATLIVGSTGSGILNIGSGGVVTSTGAAIGSDGNAGILDLSSVNVTGTGSKWSISHRLTVGLGSASQLYIDGGGRVDWGTMAYIGEASRGAVQVVGTGSQLNSSNGTLVVGFRSSGNLQIQSGAGVSNLRGYIGSALGSSSSGTGDATVTGANSFWNNGTLDVGTVGASTLGVFDSGTVRASTLTLGPFGAITLDGGVLQIGSGNMAKGGSFNWASGALAYTGDASLGAGLLDATLRLSPGRTLNVASTLTLGSGTSLQLAGGALGANALSFAGGVLQYSAADTADYSRTFSQAANQIYSIDTNGQNVMLASATKSVGGSLTKQGSGTLTLTGDNTYSSGITVAGGTLQIGNGGTKGSITGNVANAGVLAFNRSDDATFAGDISGGGVLKQLGTGTLILTGANSYNGGTTVSRGTLQVGGGGTQGSITGPVMNNGVLAFNRSDVLGFGGVTSGSGALKQLGAGTLILTGANTYSGGTTVAAGTLQIGGGGTAGSIIGNVMNTAALAFNRSDDISFAGAISGSGILKQLGSGTLTLTGTNTYSGGTQINAGRVQIASTANLGSGGLSLDGGTLAVGANSFSLGKTVQLNAGGGSFVVDAGATLTLDQPVTGTGGLTRLGAGTLQVASGSFGGGLTNGSGGTLVVTNVQAGGAVLNQGTVALTRNSRLGGSTLRNDGTITVSGSDLFNPASLKATAAGQAIVNNGQLLVSGSTLSVSGAFSNTAGGRVAVSGPALAVFLNTADFMGGQLDVSANSTVVFQGAVNQLTGAIFTGTGTKIYNKSFSLGAALPGLARDEGSVAFGSSNVFTTLIGGTAACTSACADNPGLQALSYSHYSVAGNLQLGGTLKLGSVGSFVAQAGQSFDLLDWAGLTGRFGSIDASGLQLAAGTQLDYSQLYTNGTISVTAAVPEPSTYAMLMAGLALMGTVARRRRKAIVMH